MGDYWPSVIAAVAGVMTAFFGLLAVFVTYLTVDDKKKTHLRDWITKTFRRSPEKTRIVKIAIIKNGHASYARVIRNGFISEVESLLKTTNMAPWFEEIEGAAASDAQANFINATAFTKILQRFPNGTADYLITIGTQVSIYAHKHYLGQVPIIFIGVGNPVRSGLVTERTFKGGRDRGDITGSCYGILTKPRVEFLSNLFSNGTEGASKLVFGYVCNRHYPQDAQIAEDVLQAANELMVSDQFRILEVDSPMLTEQQKKEVNILFGFYYLNAYHEEFRKSGIPLIGVNRQDVRKTAIASTGNDDFELGRIGAKQLYKNVVHHTPLCCMEIERPNTAFFAVNLNQAKRYGLDISEWAKKAATEVISAE